MPDLQRPVLTSDQLTGLLAGGGGAVSSVFGRIGAVVATSGDYTAAQVSALSTGLMTTLGDMITGGAAGAAQRLGVGSAGQGLVVSGGVPTWAAIRAASPMTTLGDIIIGGAAGAETRLGVGGSTQVLGVSGGSPAWVAVPSPAFPLTAAGDMGFQPNGIATNTLLLHNNASAVNGVQITGVATGGTPTIAAVGTDPNIPLTLASKGNSTTQFSNAIAVNGATITIVNNSNPYLLVSNAGFTQYGGFVLNTTAGNYNSDAAANDPGLIALNNSQVWRFGTNANRASLLVASVATQANAVQITGAASTGQPQVAAVGTDGTIAINLQGKGNANGVLVTNTTDTNPTLQVGIASLTQYAQLALATAGGAWLSDTVANDSVVIAKAGMLRLGVAAGPTKVGVNSTGVAFNGNAPVAKAAAITAPAATGSTSITPFGYTTAAQADAIVTAVRSIITALQNVGITS